MGLGPPPPDFAPLVVQVSRWDALKDPVGVMLGFARLVEQGRDHGAHLMLAGPNVNAVADEADTKNIVYGLRVQNLAAAVKARAEKTAERTNRKGK
jgi:hypothetical protein